MTTIYLDRNESQYGPAPACYDVLAVTGRPELARYTRDYDRGVKSRVSERIAADLGVSERNVMLGYGAELLLKMAVHRFVRRGECVLVPDASWWYYGAIAEEVGATTATYEVLSDGDTFRYDASAMIAAYEAAQPSIVLIASPNNPTGNSIDPGTLRTVLERFRHSVVIIDEAYWGYASTDNTHVAPLLAEFDNVMIIRSFSKYYALAGVRMGYAVASDRFADFATYTTLFLGYQQIAENIVLAALDSTEYYQELARVMEEDKQMYYARLAAYGCVNCYRSDGNFLLIKMHPEVETLLKQRMATIGYRPKFFSEPRFAHHMRLSLGTREQNTTVLEELIAVIEHFNARGHEYSVAV